MECVVPTYKKWDRYHAAIYSSYLTLFQTPLRVGDGLHIGDRLIYLGSVSGGSIDLETLTALFFAYRGISRADCERLTIIKVL